MAARHSRIAFIAALSLLAPAAAVAGTITANADAFQTLPGDASLTLPGIGVVPLEGAEFGAPGSDPYYPLSSADDSRLNALAPNLGSVAYQLQWADADSSVVGPTFSQKAGQVLAPALNTTPDFDTVIERLNDVTFTAGGQVQETQTQILMLNLQSVAPVVIGGFHYEMLAVLANGNPVYDPSDTSNPQYTGNLKFDSTSVSPGGGVSGTLDLGVTGPTPTAANLGADLPSGMEGLPVNFDIQFIPLDGGPAIPDMRDEVILQNTGPSSFASAVPEPGSLLLLGSALPGLGWLRRRRSRCGD